MPNISTAVIICGSQRCGYLQQHDLLCDIASLIAPDTKDVVTDQFVDKEAISACASFCQPTL